MRLSTYLQRHGQVFFGTLGRMASEPLANLLTIAVIAIAIALPTLFYLLVENISRAGLDWDGRAQISVFLKTDMDAEQAVEFGQSIMARPMIDDIEFISPDQAMQSFQASSGFGELLQQLDENPIPPLLVVFPDQGVDLTALQQLVASLQQLPQVDNASYDQLWLQRLNSILDLVRYCVIIRACMMSLGVLLVVSNTVRLSITTRHREIEIIEQVGGTHGFIRRPFLYLGVLQSVFGCIVATGLVWLVFYLVAKPVAELSRLYQSEFSLQGLDGWLIMLLILIVAMLGWLAAWIAVSRHLSNLQ